MCREVCGSIVSYRARGKMVGTDDNPIHFDEARFAGKRKYNRGRMLNGDTAPISENSDADISLLASSHRPSEKGGVEYSLGMRATVGQRHLQRGRSTTCQRDPPPYLGRPATTPCLVFVTLCNDQSRSSIQTRNILDYSFAN
ncbi:hypothetical protein GWK47_008057 [Chionoecetes opilio]|uniref:Uncharacterized protein n=1 Tax=Chionoecetes opilio TaxID=41210 RepID=A0A8J4Y081_CHIOP|nr:hypothetical protein GWK47_008057 [Chionoecetes opilio]